MSKRPIISFHHLINLYNIPEEFSEVLLDPEAVRKAHKVRVNGQEALLASPEDHVIYAVLRAREQPLLVDLAVMIIASKPLDVRYMLKRSKKMGVASDVKSLLSYVHWVMLEGWKDPHVVAHLDEYYKVAKRYFEIHRAIGDYVRPSCNGYRHLVPYEVVREAWKQLQSEYVP